MIDLSGMHWQVYRYRIYQIHTYLLSLTLPISLGSPLHNTYQEQYSQLFYMVEIAQKRRTKNRKENSI